MRLSLAILLLSAVPAWADMFQDASNAKLPTTGTPTTAICGAVTGSLLSLPAGCGIPISNAQLPNPFIIGADQAGGRFATVDILAGNAAGRNSILGQVTNTLAPATPAYPAGIAGYGKLPIGSNGNTAFGAFAVSEIYNTVGGSVIGAEFTVRNISGRNPDTDLPPNNSFGTTSITPTDLQLTCGVGTITSIALRDCSVGLIIANEDGLYTSPVFNTAEFIWLYRSEGLHIGAQPSGAQIALTAVGNGNGVVVALGTTAEPNPNYGMMVYSNHLGADLFSVNYDGSVHTNGPSAAYFFADRSTAANWAWYASGGFATLQQIGAAGPAMTIDPTGNVYFAADIHSNAMPTSGGTGGLNVCIDSSGAMYKKASCP